MEFPVQNPVAWPQVEGDLHREPECVFYAGLGRECKEEFVVQASERDSRTCVDAPITSVRPRRTGEYEVVGAAGLEAFQPSEFSSDLGFYEASLLRLVLIRHLHSHGSKPYTQGSWLGPCYDCET